MEKIIIVLLVSIASCYSGFSQQLTDKEAIIATLESKNIDGKYTWRPTDKELKKLAINILEADTVAVTSNGLSNVIFSLTSTEYDDEYDPVFLEYYFDIEFPIDSFLIESHFLFTHFRKQDYTSNQLEKFAFYAKPESILHWHSFEVADYFTFLEIKSIGATLQYLKQNLSCFDKLNPKLQTSAFGLKEIEIDVNLARLGLMNDTLVVDEIMERIVASSSTNRHLQLYKGIDLLCQLRTVYSFKAIGRILLGKHIDLSNEYSSILLGSINSASYNALAAFLKYVKNFPDRTIKIQDITSTTRLQTIIRVSKGYGTDFSTEEYLNMARAWYVKNQDNLILDHGKY